MSEIRQMLRDTAQGHLARSYDFERRRAIAAGSGFDPAQWQAFAEMGWLAAAVPEAQGGLGGLTEAAVVAEAFGGALVLEPYLPFVQSAALLADREALIAGSELIVPAFAEGASRGSLSHVATRAEDNRLTGRKSVVLGAPVADGFIVSARTRGADGDVDGITLFRVAADAPGLSLVPTRLLDGSPAGDLRLDHVAGEIVGELHQGHALLRTAREAAIIVAGAEMLGMIGRVLTLSIEHLVTRKQFGVPLASFQVLQHRIADMVIDEELARAAHEVALHALDEPDPRERDRAFLAAHTVTAEAARQVCASGIQLHGGMGMTDEHPVSHYLRRIVVLDALLGAPDRHVEQFVALAA